MDKCLEENTVSDNGDSFLERVERGEVQSKLASEACINIEGKLRDIDKKYPNLRTVDKLKYRIKVVTTKLPNNERIIPLKALRKALERDLVTCLLREHGYSYGQAEALANSIRTSFCRIMGILLELDCARSIETFVERNLDDKCIPLQTTGEGLDVCFSYDGNMIEIPGWPYDKYEDFERRQNQFVTPFLAKSGPSVPHYVLKVSERYLPIINQTDADASTGTDNDKYIVLDDSATGGGQGVVYAIQLHPLSCHFDSFPYQHKDGWLARKERRKATSKLEFLQEVYAWKEFNRKNDAKNGLRICPLVCTLQTTEGMQDRYHLVFPLATGSLTRLWSRYSRVEDYGDLLTPHWMAVELQQLSKTLSVVHHDEREGEPDDGSPHFGRFGDVKPANILWFADYIGCSNAGALLFADLGLAKIHRRITMSASFPAKAGHSGTYRAPEFTISLNERIGRRADVWSFGCTLLEHLTWYVIGNEPQSYNSRLFKQLEKEHPNFNPRHKDIQNKAPVEVFAEIREEPDIEHANVTEDRFYSLDRDGHTVKVKIRPAVENWIRVLQTHERCSPFLAELLSFVQTEMLVVNQADRATAKKVEEKMDYFVGKLVQSPGYGVPLAASQRVRR